MTEDERLNHYYIGDGIYVEKNPYGIILRTGSHRDEDCDNRIVFEPSELQKLLIWLNKSVSIKGTTNERPLLS